MDKNKREVNLLLHEPQALVAHYQSIINIVVSKFISRGFFTVEEKMDIVQNINETLLERKIFNIQRNYNGSVLLSTYFSKVIYNHCLEIARGRKNKRSYGAETLLENVSDTSLSAVNKLVLEDEVNRLSAILCGVLRCSFRLWIALKLFARIRLTKEDFLEVSVKETSTYNSFKKQFFVDYDALNDKSVYQAAIPLLNHITGKNTDADSMRKWMNMQIDKIIALQNGEPPRAQHNRETIRLLLQKYFETAGNDKFFKQLQ